MITARDLNVVGSKKRLRSEMSRRLAGMESSERESATLQVRQRIFRIPEVAQARGVLSCLSFGDEIDTWGVVDQLQARGQAVFVPRSEPRDGQLHVHPYPCELETLTFGLQQPPRTAPVLSSAEIDSQIDVVLVLALAFDRRGYRLGHGRGYFDRFLADRRLLTVGLGFETQIIDTLPREPHDVPMSMVVTDSSVYRIDV